MIIYKLMANISRNDLSNVELCWEDTNRFTNTPRSYFKESQSSPKKTRQEANVEISRVHVRRKWKFEIAFFCNFSNELFW